MHTPSLITAFDNTATTYEKVSELPDIIATRLIDRVKEFHHFKPQKILDLGCGVGVGLKRLQQYYPSAHLVGIDWSYPVLQQAKHNMSMTTQIEYIQSDMQTVAFAPQTFDLICANLSLCWIEDLPSYFAQLKKWLKSGGLLLFTGLGPSTFSPLRQLPSAYPWAFLDMHHWGDILTNTQWDDVVMDVDHFVTQHQHQHAFYRELEQLGFHTLMKEYHQYFTQGASSFNAISEVNWEVIYGHAWQHTYQKSYKTPSGDIAVPIDLLRTPR